MRIPWRSCSNMDFHPPEVSDSEVGMGSKFCVSNTLQVMLILLVLDHTMTVPESSASANLTGGSLRV